MSRSYGNQKNKKGKPKRKRGTLKGADHNDRIVNIRPEEESDSDEKENSKEAKKDEQEKQ